MMEVRYRLMALLATAVACGMLAAAPGAAQKGGNGGNGGGKPTATPAAGLFRCPGPDCPVADPSAVPAVLTDAITGDSYALEYSSADGATVDTMGELSLRLQPNGRFLFFDFSNGSALCGAECRRTFTTLAITAAHGTFLHTNVIDPVTGSEAADGLRSIPVGATWRSRLKIAFNTTGAGGESIAWAVRFNPRDYYPSDHISVTRHSATSWEIFATGAERAMLVSHCCRQKGNTNEGLYTMPFKVFVTTQ